TTLMRVENVETRNAGRDGRTIGGDPGHDRGGAPDRRRREERRRGLRRAILRSGRRNAASRATGTGRIRVLGGTPPNAPGEAPRPGASRPGYVCAWYASGLEARAGWIPQRRIAPAALLVDLAPPLAAWVGTWQQYDNKIVLTPVGDRLSASGEAYWPSKSIMPANEGEFSGTAAPSGRRLHFATDAPDPCLVDLTLAGEFLF